MHFLRPTLVTAAAALALSLTAATDPLAYTAEELIVLDAFEVRSSRVAAALVLPVLSLTGFALWWLRRQSAQARHQSLARPSPVGGLHARRPPSPNSEVGACLQAIPEPPAPDPRSPASRLLPQDTSASQGPR